MRFRDQRYVLKAARREGLPVCAWVSRHEPSPEQRASLSAYAIVQIGADDRLFKDAPRVWRAIQDECKGNPALIMAVLPKLMIASLVMLVKPIPVLRAQMVATEVDGEPVWDGTWLQVMSVRLLEHEWSPESEVW